MQDHHIQRVALSFIERMINEICADERNEIVERFLVAIDEVDKLLLKYDEEIARGDRNAVGGKEREVGVL